MREPDDASARQSGARVDGMADPGELLINETVASLPGPIQKIARQEQGESTWDPLNASGRPPTRRRLEAKPNVRRHQN